MAGAETAKNCHGNRINSPSANPTMIAVTNPPIDPSRAFPGLILGASFRFPNLRPMKYAPVSTELVVNSTYSINHPPLPM